MQSIRLKAAFASFAFFFHNNRMATFFHFLCSVILSVRGENIPLAAYFDYFFTESGNTTNRIVEPEEEILYFTVLKTGKKQTKTNKVVCQMAFCGKNERNSNGKE